MDELKLVREPRDKYEHALVNGFPQIETLERIWVREVPSMLTGGLPKYRVWLAFSLMDQGSRHLADRIQEAYEMRFHFEDIEFEFIHIPFDPQDRVPKGLPALIWKRPPKIWMPTEIKNL